MKNIEIPANLPKLIGDTQNRIDDEICELIISAAKYYSLSYKDMLSSIITDIELQNKIKEDFNYEIKITGNHIDNTNINNDIVSWGQNLSKTQRRNIRLKAKKLNITPEEYMILQSTYKEVDIDRKLNSTKKRNKLTADAKALGMTVEEYKAKNSSQGISKKRQRKERLEQNYNIALAVPKYDFIKIKDWECDEVKSWTLDFPKLEEVKNNQRSNLNDNTGDQRHNTFIDPETGFQFPEIEIKKKIWRLITDDRMKDIENDFAKKVGNENALGLHKWIDKVYKLWKPVEYNPNKDILDESKEYVLKYISQCLYNTFGDKKLNPLGLDEAYQEVTKGRHSGFPYFTSKWAEDPEMVEDYLMEAERMLTKGDFSNQPCVLFSRTQANGEIPKMRPVICPPKSEAIAAKCFTVPLLQAFKESKHFTGFNGGENLGDICNDILQKSHIYVSSDFSAFDTTCKEIMIDVFDIIKRLVDPIYFPYLDGLVKYYRHINLITPIGWLSSKMTNGLPSGGGWTSIIGTICNLLANIYTLKRMNFYFSHNAEERNQVQILSYGDDCVLGVPKRFKSKWDTNKYCQIMQELGMECNPSKQEITIGDKGYFSFLGYYWFKSDIIKGEEAKPVFPIFRALSGLIYFETFLRPQNVIEEIKPEMTQEEIEKALEIKEDGIRKLGHLMKLENLRNHKDFKAFIKFFREYEQDKMDTELILPFAKFIKTIKTHRYCILEKGLEHSKALKELYRLEEKEIIEFNLREEHFDKEHNNNLNVEGMLEVATTMLLQRKEEEIIQTN